MVGIVPACMQIAEGAWLLAGGAGNAEQFPADVSSAVVLWRLQINYLLPTADASSAVVLWHLPINYLLPTVN